MAFEIEVEKRALGYGTQSGGSAENRLLIVFWVDPIPGSRSYRYRFDLKKSLIQGAAIRFRNMRKLSRSY
jgi:hypothetical protein